MRPYRFIGILERRLLGAAMSAILYVVERRLRQRDTSAHRTARTVQEQPGGESAAYTSHRRWNPSRHPRRVRGHGRSNERAAETEGEG
jgi:hypothetical protein